jgi:hypothetical protein
VGRRRRCRSGLRGRRRAEAVRDTKCHH